MIGLEVPKPLLVSSEVASGESSPAMASPAEDSNSGDSSQTPGTLNNNNVVIEDQIKRSTNSNSTIAMGNYPAIDQVQLDQWPHKQRVENTMVSTSTGHSVKRASTTSLLREAARMEALKFMPQVATLLDSDKLPPATKIKLLEVLLHFGIGAKDNSKPQQAVVERTAVIALMPRQDASSVLPLANPSQPSLMASRGLPAPLQAIVDRADALLKAEGEP